MFNTTTVFKAIYDSLAKIIILQGGTSSSKTVSALQENIFYAVTNKDKVVTVTAESIPNLRKGAYRDTEWLYSTSEYFRSQVKFWNKSDRIIYLKNGSMIEFISNQDEQGAKAGKRDRLFVDEAQSVPWSIFFQLAIRTRDKVMIAYNPSISFWAHEKLIGTTPESNELSATVQLIISDHRHNTFLSEEDHRKIEGIKDKELWNVYARGRTGNLTGIIYPDWQMIPNDQFPKDNQSFTGGLDFGYCVDDETEILTHSGWKKYYEVTISDFALTLNMKSGMSEWKKIEAINIFNGKYEMCHIEKLGHDSYTTLNHKWPIYNHKNYKFKETSSLSGDDNIPAARECSSLPKAKYSDHFVELVAWFWTEGQITEGGVSFWQNEGWEAHSMRRCLQLQYGKQLTKTRNGPNRAVSGWIERPKRKNLCHFAVNLNGMSDFLAVAPNKIISCDFINSLTLKQLELFISISVCADGSTTKNGTKIITQSCKERLDPVQMICALAGIRTTLKFTGEKGKYKSPTWRLTIFKSRKNIFINESKRTLKIYTGFIWCPTVENSTWFARRNGTTYFTGNTNDPSAGVKKVKIADTIYLDELFYECALPPISIAQILKAEGFKSNNAVFCEHHPEMITELRKLGIQAVKASKGPGSLDAGIMRLKQYKVFYTERSKNIQMERSKYMWAKDPVTGKSTNVPIDAFNHILDAARYSEFSNVQKI